MNIEEAIEEYAQTIETLRENNTARTYKDGMNYFKMYLKDIGITLPSPTTDLTAQHFMKFFTFLKNVESPKTGQKLDPASVRVYATSVTRFASWIIKLKLGKLEYVDLLNIQDTMSESLGKKRAKKPFRRPEELAAEKMIESVYQMKYSSPGKERNIALFEFLYSTGCRINEALSLKIQDLDMTNGTVMFGNQNTKDKEFRVVPFTNKAKNALRRYWLLRGFSMPNNPVFCRHDRGAGKTPKSLRETAVRNIFDEVSMLAGLEKGSFTPHSFRHAFAIFMLRKTRNLVLVQKLLGHSDPKTTRIYADMYEDELVELYRDVFDEK